MYRDQPQDDIGEGHFVGVELTLVFGFETLSMINGAIKEHERSKSY